MHMKKNITAPLILFNKYILYFSGMTRKDAHSTGEHRVLAQLVPLYQVTAIATLSCGSVKCISKNKLGRVTGAGSAWDPGTLTGYLDCKLPQD